MKVAHIRPRYRVHVCVMVNPNGPDTSIGRFIKRDYYVTGFFKEKEAGEFAKKLTRAGMSATVESV